MKISLEDIAIQLAGQRLFNHITWTIEHNQHWAILGPTGAGKSVLAKALARKVPIIQGHIVYSIDGPSGLEERSFLHPDEILILSAETHQVFLRQYAEYHQARWQSLEGEDTPTVSELLSAGSLAASISPFSIQPNTAAQDARRAEVIALLKLDYLLDRKILNLSHGESRKVHLARLLIRSPRLLILDDPFTGLDVESRGRLALGIEAILTSQVTQVLLVSSRVEEIPRGMDHLLVLKAGQVVAQGPREEVWARACQETALPAREIHQPLFQKSAAFHQVVEKYSLALEQNPAAGSAEYIAMRDVSVTYGDVEILKGIDWTVRRGERWVLSGDNGAGKTTLLSLVMADNPQAYRSSISLFGRERGSGESIWEIKRNIGWVSPELNIYYPKTASGLDVVCSGFFDSVGLYRRCTPGQLSRAEEWLRAFGIERLAGEQFQALSSGQQRLVLLARALVKDPPLLILDEPCQALDEAHRQYFLELLDQLCAHTPISLVYVTHYAAEILPSMTHHLKLERGKVIYIRQKFAQQTFDEC